MTAQEPWQLGLDLGGTRLKALCLTPAGREISRTTAPTGGDDWREAVKACVAELFQRHGQPASIGVAAFPEDASDAKSLIEVALRAMAHAQAEGRNRVEGA